MSDIVERLHRAIRTGHALGHSMGDLIAAAEEIERLRVTLDTASRALRSLREMSDRMAENDGLWFETWTVAEAYLQQELRRLCAAIEGTSPDDCARAAIREVKDE